MTDTVAQIMTKDIFFVEAHQTLPEAREMFAKNHIRHLPVVKEGNLVGMLSRTDIMRLSFGETYGQNENEVDEAMFDLLKIEDVMTQNPKVVAPSDNLQDVAGMLAQEEFHALPVAVNGDLQGIITTTDIIKHLLGKLEAVSA